MSIKYKTNGALALKPAQHAPQLRVISTSCKNGGSRLDSLCQHMFGYLHEQSAVFPVQMALKGAMSPSLFGNASERRFVRVACAVSVAALFFFSFVSFS